MAKNKTSETMPAKKRRSGLRISATMEAYTFMMPFIIGIAVFFIFPLTLLARMSFSKLENVVGLQMKWWGLNNFKEAFIIDTNFMPNLLQSVSDTLLKVPLIIIFALIIAIMVNKNIKFKGMFRTIFFLPFLLGNGYVMEQLMQQDVSGRAIQSAQQFFMPPEVLQYLGTTATDIIGTFFSIIIVILWSSGVQILLFLSGLQGISQSYYEAARVESANEWDCFWHITLPMMSPIMLLCIVYSLVDMFTGISNPVLTFTRGIMRNLRYDYASAVGLIYSLFILLVVFIVMLVMRKAMFTTETRGGKK